MYQFLYLFLTLLVPFGIDGIQWNIQLSSWGGLMPPKVPPATSVPQTEEDLGGNASLPVLEEIIEDNLNRWESDRWFRRIRRRSVHSQSSNHRQTGFHKFFNSVGFYEWALFFGAMLLLAPAQWCLVAQPSTMAGHVYAIFFLAVAAIVYAVLICHRMGPEALDQWLAGYFLELIFSIENVFVFMRVIAPFQIPADVSKRVVRNSLCLVVGFQIVFEMVFYMGLANWLQSLVVLPYVLGIWLVYIGYWASQDETEEGKGHSIKDSLWLSIFQSCLPCRLAMDFGDAGEISSTRNGLRYFTLTGVLVCCLLVVDFGMEIDVTLTKIEEMPNDYLAFTSSALAAFVVPELYFVASAVFDRFFLLKYGISLLLVFVGVQMCFFELFTINMYISTFIMVAVLGGLIILNPVAVWLGWGPTAVGKALDDTAKDRYAEDTDAATTRSLGVPPPVEVSVSVPL